MHCDTYSERFETNDTQKSFEKNMNINNEHNELSKIYKNNKKSNNEINEKERSVLHNMDLDNKNHNMNNTEIILRGGFLGHTTMNTQKKISEVGHNKVEAYEVFHDSFNSSKTSNNFNGKKIPNSNRQKNKVDTKNLNLINQNVFKSSFSSLNLTNQKNTTTKPNILSKMPSSNYLKWFLLFVVTCFIVFSVVSITACCCIKGPKRLVACCLPGKDWGSYEISQLSVRPASASCHCHPPFKNELFSNKASSNRPPPNLNFSAFGGSNKHLCCGEAKQNKNKKQKKKLKQDFKMNKKKEREWYV